MLRPLTPEQRSTVGSVLAEFVEREPSEFIRGHAAKAVQLIDNLLPSLEQ